LIRIVAVCAGLFSVAGYSNTLSWSGGGGANANWNNSANWGFAGTPANGDTLIFSASQPNLLNTNNIAGLTLNQIRFVGAGGGYDLRGNAFTLTNSIMATNTAGANTIENNITLATANVLIVVSNGVSLTLDSTITGSVGVKKAGLGTLTYQGPGDNIYTGTTLVSGGTLQLNVGGYNAFGGPLVIGDGTGTGSPTVQDLQYEEISETAPITINLNGTLNLNNFVETIGTSLSLNSATIQTGAGTLTLSPNATMTVTDVSHVSSISGNLNLGTSGTCTIQGSGSVNIYAAVSGAANLVKNGSANIWFANANTFTGSLTANGSGYVDIATSTSLGTTNGGTTINGSVQLIIEGNVNVTNENLTMNSTYPNGAIWFATPSAVGSWTATNITLSANTTILIATNASLTLVGPITGSGGVTKIGPGTLTYQYDFGNNEYSGTTRVNAGTLQLNVAGSSAFGGPLVIGDGSGAAAAVRNLQSEEISQSVSVTINAGGVLDVNNFSETIGTSLTLSDGTIQTGSGTLTLLPNSTVTEDGISSISGHLNIGSGNCTMDVEGVLHIPASVSGSANLIKTGLFSLVLESSNSYSGLTIVAAGYLDLENSWALGSTSSGTIVTNQGSLVLKNNIGITNESLTLYGPGGGWGDLACADATTNYWVGPIALNGNCLIEAVDPASALHLNSPITGPGGIEMFTPPQYGFPAGGQLYLEGASANTYTGTTTVDTGSMDSTTLLLNKPSSVYAVPTNLVIAGTVKLLNPDQIQNDADVTVQSTGHLLLNGNYCILDGLSGNGAVDLGSAVFLAIGWFGGSSTFDGIISGIGSLYKYGSGTITLNGNNTYPGMTVDFAPGKLVINGFQPQSPVRVYSGGTLGGSGTVGDIVAAGTVSPGASPGTLTCSNLTFIYSGIPGGYSVELTGPTPGTGYDQLNVRGTNNLASAGLSINLAFTTPVALGQQFTIINNDGADPITGIFAGYPQGSTWLQNGFKVAISYFGGTGNDVVLTLTAIPGAAVSSSVTSGDGNHGIDPNDCNNLSLVITNQTGSPMTGINATLSTTTEGVIISQPYSTYPNIPASGSGTNLAPFQISTLPSFVCGTDIKLQLIVDSSLGSFTTAFVQHTGEPAASVRFDNNNVTNCPDVGIIESTNTVASWSGGPITKVAVSLWLVAPIDSDLNLTLIAPDGTPIDLSSGNGAGANFGTGNPDANRTTFDDAAGTSITAGTAPFVGSFRPEASLSTLAGTSPVGAWRLRVQDLFGSGSPDTLRNWSLFLYGTACSSGSGACDLCLSAISGAITTGDPVQTGRWIGNSVVASCGTPKTWAGTSAGSLHYDVYTFTNTSPADACVTVELQSPSNILATAYLNSFNPASITSNYLGDAGNSTHGGQTTFSCTVPAGATLWVVVTEVIANAGTQPYTLQLSGLPCPPPTLSIQPVPANKARLYWPTWAGGYKLEGTPSLLQTNWIYVTNEPIVSALKYNVTNSTINPTNRFYRLHKP
jgi:autotransporter-associated beta strand protein